MSIFKINHEEAKGFEPVKPGEYEVTVINYEQKTSSNGNPMIVVDYEIRSDVAQPAQGQKILYDHFVVTEKSMWRFHAISKAAQFPDGMEFSSYKEWADTLLGKHLVIDVIDGEPNQKGNVYPEVKAFKESVFGAPKDDAPVVKPGDVPF